MRESVLRSHSRIFVEYRLIGDVLDQLTRAGTSNRPILDYIMRELLTIILLIFTGWGLAYLIGELLTFIYR